MITYFAVATITTETINMYLSHTLFPGSGMFLAGWVAIFSAASEPKYFSHFGDASSTIHFEGLECTGAEEHIFDCGYRTDHDCNHNENAGVVCGLDTECNHTDIRLVGGENEREGRVEICTYGLWGRVCGSEWDIIDARVFCKELGYPHLGEC